MKSDSRYMRKRWSFSHLDSTVTDSRSPAARAETHTHTVSLFTLHRNIVIISQIYHWDFMLFDHIPAHIVHLSDHASSTLTLRMTSSPDFLLFSHVCSSAGHWIMFSSLSVWVLIKEETHRRSGRCVESSCLQRGVLFTEQHLTCSGIYTVLCDHPPNPRLFTCCFSLDTFMLTDCCELFVLTLYKQLINKQKTLQHTEDWLSTLKQA